MAVAAFSDVEDAWLRGSFLAFGQETPSQVGTHEVYAPVLIRLPDDKKMHTSFSIPSWSLYSFCYHITLILRTLYYQRFNQEADDSKPESHGTALAHSRPLSPSNCNPSCWQRPCPTASDKGPQAKYGVCLKHGAKLGQSAKCRAP